MLVKGLLISCTTLADNLPKEAIVLVQHAGRLISGDIPGQIDHSPNLSFLIKQRMADHYDSFPAILVKVDDGGRSLLVATVSLRTG
jgi:hypothetical protein